MYQKILVPLDGSELAECVIPHVEAIAGGCDVGNVVLLRVAEPVKLFIGEYQGFSGEDWQQIEAEHRTAAENYLKQLMGRLNLDGVNLQSKVIVGGNVAEDIAHYAHDNQVDLIIIATHGRSGLSRWVWGSVADRVLRASTVPVLMVRAPGSAPGI